MKLLSKLSLGFFSIVGGAVIAIVAVHFTSWGKEAAPQINVETTPINRDARLGNSYASVIKKAAPSVVNIYSTRIVQDRPMRNLFQDDPFFRQFFGDQFPGGNEQPRSHKDESLGSGVIISPDGYILTANHVVAGADEIKIAIGDSKDEYTAKVIGTDPPTDVAVLKIDATGLPAITLADSDQLEIGDVVLAIGNPFNIGQTVTMGIVSGLGRHGYGINGANGYEDFIQTDAAINPGNSGGALVDAEGRLVGINTWIATSSGGSEGVGFAVPVNIARHVMENLISRGKVSRGFIGVSLQDFDASLAKQFDLPDQNGALVDDVMPNTPAEKAGIKSGDVIVAFNGKEITDASGLQLLASESAPGSPATVKLIRNGHTKIITMTLGEKKQDKAAQNESDQNTPAADNSKIDGLDGVTVSDLDSDARQQLKAPDNIHGAVVTDVDQNSNSAEAGLQPGDVIVEINHQPVVSADDAVRLCKQIKSPAVLLKIWRREGDFAGTHYLSVDNTKEK